MSEYHFMLGLCSSVFLLFSSQKFVLVVKSQCRIASFLVYLLGCPWCVQWVHPAWACAFSVDAAPWFKHGCLLWRHLVRSEDCLEPLLCQTPWSRAEVLKRFSISGSTISKGTQIFFFFIFFNPPGIQGNAKHLQNVVLKHVFCCHRIYWGATSPCVLKEVTEIKGTDQGNRCTEWEICLFISHEFEISPNHRIT